MAVARMPWADRDRRRAAPSCGATASGSPTPAPRVLPGLPGAERRRLEWVYPAATPLVAPSQAWHDGDDRVDAFWGPSVHWNTALEQYVMLLNRAKDENYARKASTCRSRRALDDPSLWSRRRRC